MKCNHKFGPKWPSSHVAITAGFSHVCFTTALLLHLRRNLWNLVNFCWMLYLSPSYIGSLFASKPCTTLPQPMLDIYVKSKDSVVLVCRSPEGYHGVVFMLYRLTEKVIILRMCICFLGCVIQNTSGLLWFHIFYVCLHSLRLTLGNCSPVRQRFSSPSI